LPTTACQISSYADNVLKCLREPFELNARIMLLDF
jgi:hypothetical protein